MPPNLADARYLSITQVCAIFPGRSRRWIEDRVKAGAFGKCLQAGGWLVPAAGVAEFIRSHEVDVADLPRDLAPGNLVQFRRDKP